MSKQIKQVVTVADQIGVKSLYFSFVLCIKKRVVAGEYLNLSCAKHMNKCLTLF